MDETLHPKGDRDLTWLHARNEAQVQVKVGTADAGGRDFQDSVSLHGRAYDHNRLAEHVHRKQLSVCSRYHEKLYSFV